MEPLITGVILFATILIVSTMIIGTIGIFTFMILLAYTAIKEWRRVGKARQQWKKPYNDY